LSQIKVLNLVRATGLGCRMAATNKSLAQINKSWDGGKVTKNRIARLNRDINDRK